VLKPLPTQSQQKRRVDRAAEAVRVGVAVYDLGEVARIRKSLGSLMDALVFVSLIFRILLSLRVHGDLPSDTGRTQNGKTTPIRRPPIWLSRQSQKERAIIDCHSECLGLYKHPTPVVPSTLRCCRP
jgi:hypothetical protein